MKFFARNPGMLDLFRITEQDYTLTGHKLIDRLEPRELSLTVARDVPVPQFAEVIAASEGRPLFRGYVDTYEIDSKRTKTLECLGAEGWLNRRNSIAYFYESGVLLSDLFSDTCINGSVPGLLAIANSSVPPGLAYVVHSSSDNQIKIPGGGKSGRFATRDFYSADYRYLNKIDETTDLSLLQYLDNIFYRDDNDVYIKINNHRQRGWPDLGGLLVENAFDTGVRLGNVVNQGLKGDLQTTQSDKIGDMIVDVALGHGKHVHITDDWSRTYINIDDIEGRETGYSIYEKDMINIQKSTPEDSKVHCLVGQGVGNQYHSLGDLSHKGFWNQDFYEVEHGFKDDGGILKSHVAEKYNQRQTDWQWRVAVPQTEAGSLLLNPGDFIRIYPYHEKPEYMSCQLIEDSPGQVVLELGARRPRYIDAWEVLQGMDRSYTDRYLRTAHQAITQSCTFYPSDPAHTATAGTTTFAVPAGVLDYALRPRITLSLRLNLTSNKSLNLGRVAVSIAVGGVLVPFGQLSATTIGDAAGEGIPEIDITNYITANANNTITYNVYMALEFSDAHSDSTGHPQISASATMNFYKRGDIA